MMMLRYLLHVMKRHNKKVMMHDPEAIGILMYRHSASRLHHPLPILDVNCEGQRTDWAIKFVDHKGMKTMKLDVNGTEPAYESVFQDVHTLRWTGLIEQIPFDLSLSRKGLDINTNILCHGTLGLDGDTNRNIYMEADVPIVKLIADA